MIPTKPLSRHELLLCLKQVALLCFYEELKEATLAGEKRPVGVALREAQLWLRDATLTDILTRVQASHGSARSIDRI